MEGKWAKENVDFVKMIDEEGHTIGNHAYNHPDMAKLSNHEIKDQIEQTNEIIKQLSRKILAGLRPQVGVFLKKSLKWQITYKWKQFYGQLIQLIGRNHPFLLC